MIVVVVSIIASFRQQPADLCESIKTSVKSLGLVTSGTVNGKMSILRCILVLVILVRALCLRRIKTTLRVTPNSKKFVVTRNVRKSTFRPRKMQVLASLKMSRTFVDIIMV